VPILPTAPGSDRSLVVPRELHVPVLVLGGGTGGAGAALQCARSGVACLLATPGPWLGGMLSASGVSAPDGNELAAWQTGLWGALLRQLRRDLPEGLDHNWVSCFGFRPADAERVLQRWVEAEPLLDWRPGLVLRELEQRGSSFTAAILEGSDGLLRIRFEMLVDGSELGDALAVGRGSTGRNPALRRRRTCSPTRSSSGSRCSPPPGWCWPSGDLAPCRWRAALWHRPLRRRWSGTRWTGCWPMAACQGIW